HCFLWTGKTSDNGNQWWKTPRISPYSNVFTEALSTGSVGWKSRGHFDLLKADERSLKIESSVKISKLNQST
ncbi:unnamed protein product, partial [Cyprideis torosa]